MKIILSIFIICLSYCCFSQFQDRTELSAAGGDVTTSAGTNYSYTVGGLAVTTSTTNSFVITQGFEQPELGPSDFFTFDPPNAFSPDGDGVNDIWILPLPEEFLEVVDVTIFNRWGDQIGYVENYNNADNSWNGTYSNSGQAVISGTYFYIIESQEHNRKFSGWVQVVRGN